MTTISAILQRSIALFPDRLIPRDLEERNDTLNALPDAAGEAFERLDAEFFVLGGDVLLARLVKYWNQHA